MRERNLAAGTPPGSRSTESNDASLRCVQPSILRAPPQ